MPPRFSHLLRFPLKRPCISFATTCTCQFAGCWHSLFNKCQPQFLCSMHASLGVASAPMAMRCILYPDPGFASAFHTLSLLPASKCTCARHSICPSQYPLYLNALQQRLSKCLSGRCPAQVQVGSLSEALSVLRGSCQSRRKGATGVNAWSSCSHSVVNVNLYVPTDHLQPSKGGKPLAPFPAPYFIQSALRCRCGVFPHSLQIADCLWKHSVHAV